MFIKKFKGNSQEEIEKLIQEDLGPDAIILNIRELVDSEGEIAKYEAIAASEKDNPLENDLKALEILKCKLLQQYRN